MAHPRLFLGMPPQVLHLEGILPVGFFVTAVRHRDPVHLGGHDIGQRQRNHVTDLEFHDLAQGKVGGGEIGDQIDPGILDLPGHALQPSHVGLGAVGGESVVEDVAQRLDHGIRQADDDVAAASPDVDRETS